MQQSAQNLLIKHDDHSSVVQGANLARGVRDLAGGCSGHKSWPKVNFEAARTFAAAQEESYPVRRARVLVTGPESKPNYDVFIWMLNRPVLRSINLEDSPNASPVRE